MSHHHLMTRCIKNTFCHLLLLYYILKDSLPLNDHKKEEEKEKKHHIDEQINGNPPEVRQNGYFVVFHVMAGLIRALIWLASAIIKGCHLGSPHTWSAIIYQLTKYCNLKILSLETILKDNSNIRLCKLVSEIQHFSQNITAQLRVPIATK